MGRWGRSFEIEGWNDVPFGSTLHPAHPRWEDPGSQSQDTLYGQAVSWGTQRQETQVRHLSSPPTPPAASHTTLRFISGKRKHDHIFLSALLCPSVLTAPTQTFHRILAQKYAPGGSGLCEHFFFLNLGKNWSLLRSR